MRVGRSVEKPSVHPSRASEPVLSLTKERTEERSKSLEISVHAELVEAFLRFFSRSQKDLIRKDELVLVLGG
jgi:hypothetical protein